MLFMFILKIIYTILWTIGMPFYFLPLFFISDSLRDTIKNIKLIFSDIWEDGLYEIT